MILEVFGTILGAVTLFLGLVALLLEIQYRFRFQEQIEINLSDWHLEIDPSNRARMTGVLMVWNGSHTREVILLELQLHVTPISAMSFNNTAYKAHVFSRESSLPRADGYWEACMVQDDQPLGVKFWVEISENELNPASVELQVHTVLYGRAGHIPQVCRLVIPFSPWVPLFSPLFVMDGDY